MSSFECFAGGNKAKAEFVEGELKLGLVEVMGEEAEEGVEERGVYTLNEGSSNAVHFENREQLRALKRGVEQSEGDGVLKLAGNGGNNAAKSSIASSGLVRSRVGENVLHKVSVEGNGPFGEAANGKVEGKVQVVVGGGRKEVVKKVRAKVEHSGIVEKDEQGVEVVGGQQNVDQVFVVFKSGSGIVNEVQNKLN